MSLDLLLSETVQSRDGGLNRLELSLDPKRRESLISLVVHLEKRSL